MQKSIHQSKALVNGTIILMIAAIITKILSAFYRIPFQNIVGDIGFYIYQQIYPFYGMAIVLSTTGFPVVISKLYAEQKEKGDDLKPRLLLFVSFAFLQSVGIILFLILYFGARGIAGWMNDPELAILLRVVSIVFLTFPIVALFRGYYQGVSVMVPTALSQVGEQVVRVGTILLLSYIFMERGLSLYLVGGGAMAGSITGSVVSAFILFMFLGIRKEWEGIKPRRNMLSLYKNDVKVFVKALVFQGLMICLSGMLMVFIQLADAFNLFSLLVDGGMKEEIAKSVKGIFDRGQPLIQLGTVAATSMSLTLVPLISRERIVGNSQELRGKIQLALKMSLVIGLGASAGLWAIIEPTNTMLFENEAGSSVLGVLSFVILFTSLISTLIAIMQGMGSLTYPACAVTAVLPLKYGFNLLLIPIWGIMGAAVATLLSLGIVTCLLWLRFRRTTAVSCLSLGFFRIVLIATAAMVLLLKAYLFISDPLFNGLDRIGAALQALSAVCCGGLVFLVIIIRGRVFLAGELALFPFGSKLLHLSARKDRS